MPTVCAVPRFLPLKAGSFRWGSGFGPRSGTAHLGQDFEAVDGTPIYAAQGGDVAYIGAAAGFGQWIVLDHPAVEGAGTTVYGHMWNAFATGLKQGDRVRAGQLIGYVGANGQATGPHLHFEVHPTVWRAGSQIDPRPWLAGALNPGGNVGVSGDPVWLEDVLRPALGDRLRTLPGWKTDGVGGTMGTIWGVIWHHTGNAAEKPESISKGRPDLPGPLAQIHIAPDGIVTIVAVGPCNHAGRGSWPGLPTDNANAYTIGIECAYPRDTSLTEETIAREPWPAAQIISMRDVGAALTKHLQVPVSHNISHAQWARFGPAGVRQYKWDPGNLDMDWFRGEIQKDIDGYLFPGEEPTTTLPASPDYPREIWDQLRIEWPQLGGRTLVNAVAVIGKQLGINGFAPIGKDAS
ncbi:peptidoglycan-binding domain 1 protein [Mycobacteroides abscessus subsp. massiliense]|nr:peptidoglycan-binding domain 1 protein [Mycobacteroides abscessus subsp. massiliense]